MGRSSHPRPIRHAPLIGLLGAALALAAGCSGGGNAADATNQAGGNGAPAAVTVSGLPDLAKKVGCGGKLTGQTKAAELNQGVCKTSKGRFTLLTFASDQGQAAWLVEAKEWGGAYLVGQRWIAVSQEPNLKSLQKTLGGAIELGRQH
jgi:hypothetical protein